MLAQQKAQIYNINISITQQTEPSPLSEGAFCLTLYIGWSKFLVELIRWCWASVLVLTIWYSCGTVRRDCLYYNRSKSSGRTCLDTQTKQKINCIILFCKEWEIQCECVGKPVNHCCVAKTTEKKKQRNNERLWKQGPFPQRIKITS